jgi:hypothetical protein
VDASGLYWVEDDVDAGTSTIKHAALDGSNAEKLTSTTEAIHSPLRLDTHAIVWMQGASPGPMSIVQLYR